MKKFYNRFSEYLVFQLEKNANIQSVDIPIVRYTLDYLYQTAVYHAVLLLLGVLFRQLLFTIIYILTMGCLKRYTGGAHAPGSHLCSVLSYSIFLATMYLNSHLIITSGFLIGSIFILNTLITLFLAPVECRNKKFDQSKRHRLKCMTAIVITVISVTLGCLLICKEYYTANIILTCLSVNTVNLVVGFILNKKEVNDVPEHSNL